MIKQFTSYPWLQHLRNYDLSHPHVPMRSTGPDKVRVYEGKGPKGVSTNRSTHIFVFVQWSVCLEPVSIGPGPVCITVTSGHTHLTGQTTKGQRERREERRERERERGERRRGERERERERERGICQQFSWSSNRLSRCEVAVATRLRLLTG